MSDIMLLTLPPAKALGHVKEGGNSTNDVSNKEADQKDSGDGPMFIGAGPCLLALAPHQSLVQQIWSGEYVDICEKLSRKKR